MTENNGPNEDDLDDLIDELKDITESDLSTPSQVENAEELLREIEEHLNGSGNNERS